MAAARGGCVARRWVEKTVPVVPVLQRRTGTLQRDKPTDRGLSASTFFVPVDIKYVISETFLPADLSTRH